MSLNTPLPQAPLTPAEQLAANLDAIHKSGNSYMDVPAQVAIAAGQQNEDQTLSIVDTINKAISSNKSAVESFFADAQQSRIPSITQKATSLLKSVYDPSIITENHVYKIQQDMIKAKAAPDGAVANGVWDSSWTNAMANYRVESFDKPTVGNAPAKSTVQHVLGALSFSRNVNVLLQVVKQMPGSLRQLIGDAVGETGSMFGKGFYSTKVASEKKAQIASATENLLGAKTTAKEIKQKELQRSIEDLGTLLIFLPMARLGSGLKTAGVTAKTGKVLTAAEVAPKYTLLNSMVSTAEKGTIGIMQPSARAFLNKPILNSIYKGVAVGISKTAPIQIPIRNTIAQRLRLPIVRAANQAGLAVLGAGLKEQAIALGESKLGAREGILDTTVYGLAPISGKLAAALDIFSIQMNPGGPARAGVKEIIGDTTKAGVALRNAMDDMGALRAWQKANPQIDYPALVADHVAAGGSETDILKTIGQQLNKVALDHAMDIEKAPLIEDGTWLKMTKDEREEWAQKTQQMIWREAAVNPKGRLAASRETLVADHNAMETGFRDIGVQASGDFRASSLAKKGTSSFANQVKANAIFENALTPELQKYFIHPSTLNEYKVQKPLQAEKSLLAQSDLEAGIGTGEVPPSKLNISDISNPEMADGAAGLARIDTLTKNDAKKLYNKLFQQVQDAGTPEERMAAKIAIGKALIEEFGVNVYKLGGHDSYDLLALVETEGNKLAGDLHLMKDAPEELKAMVAQLKDLGYKPVYGTDIGHQFTKGVQYTNLGAADIRKTSKAYAWLGISPRLSSSEAVSARSNVEQLRTLQNGIDSGKIEVLPGFNASYLRTYIYENLPKVSELTLGQRAVLGFARAEVKFLKKNNYEIPIKRLMEADTSLTKDEAWNKIKEAKKSELGLREVHPDVLMGILTKPLEKDVAALMGLDAGTPFMSEESARQTIQALWRARVNVPMEMIGGLAKIEDILYAGMGIGNTAWMEKVGLGNFAKQEWVQKAAFNIKGTPARLQNLRSRVRYQESIVFAYRRMSKTMLKGITEDIPPVMYPESKMEEMGITSTADKIYKRIFPENLAKDMFLDDAERVIKEADFYNLYSPREYEKWSAYWLSKKGYSDKEIIQKLENVMGYGERTAAERSLNAIFFPFSFNKTVMRQFGTFLLTRPGERLVIEGIMEIYDQVDGPKFRKWMEDNTPLIKQVEQLNALKHGVGLGQFGGINTPYISGLLTLLGPKTLDYGAPKKNDGNLQLLKQYVPMVKEFMDLFIDKNKLAISGQVGDTIKTGLGLAENVTNRLTGRYTVETDWHPNPHPLMPDAAQQTAAWDYRSRLITGLAPVLERNYQNPNNRIVWPDWIPVETGLIGKPINKATIGELVHYKYPAWDNAQSAVISQRKLTEADRFIGETTARNPQLGADYRKFENAAVRVSNAVNKDSVSLGNLAKITDMFRGIAIDLSARDRNFADFYKTHYERLFGPLEGFKP